MGLGSRGWPHRPRCLPLTPVTPLVPASSLLRLLCPRRCPSVPFSHQCLSWPSRPSSYSAGPWLIPSNLLFSITGRRTAPVCGARSHLSPQPQPGLQLPHAVSPGVPQTPHTSCLLFLHHLILPPSWDLRDLSVPLPLALGRVRGTLRLVVSGPQDCTWRVESPCLI